jgi:hypothetical protein
MVHDDQSYAHGHWFRPHNGQPALAVCGDTDFQIRSPQNRLADAQLHRVIVDEQYSAHGQMNWMPLSIGALKFCTGLARLRSAHSKSSQDFVFRAQPIFTIVTMLETPLRKQFIRPRSDLFMDIDRFDRHRRATCAGCWFLRYFCGRSLWLRTFACAFCRRHDASPE